MTLRRETLETIKSELIARRDSLSAEITRATEEFIADDVSFADSVDQASADTDKTIAVAMKNRDREVLLKLNNAIRKIENGSFGVCGRCDIEISEARMKANPSTTLCIDCQSELESENRSFARRA